MKNLDDVSFMRRNLAELKYLLESAEDDPVLAPQLKERVEDEYKKLQEAVNNLTIEEKCVSIVRTMLEMANNNKQVYLETDFGGFTATVYIDTLHTHIGIPGKDGSFEQYVDNLYNVLHGGPGLSFA